MNIEFIEIDSNGYHLSDAPNAAGPSVDIAPHIAPDSTKPDGMRKARFTGTWDDVAREWIGGSWVDEEAAQLEAELFAQQVERKNNDIRTGMDAALANGFTCTNGITMDATDTDIRKLDDGWRLAQRLGATTMDVRDFNNVRHLDVALADVETMVNELGANWLTQWGRKCELQEQVAAIVERTALPPTDANYLDHTAAMAELKLIS